MIFHANVQKWIFVSYIKWKENHYLEITTGDPNQWNNDINDMTINTKDKNNPRWITHSVLVLQRPQIFTAHSQANLTVIKGTEGSSN